MRRREFITRVGGAAVAWPLAVRAQQDQMRRVGALLSLAESDPEAKIWLEHSRASCKGSDGIKAATFKSNIVW